MMVAALLQEEEEEQIIEPKIEQVEFTVNLVKFDPATKVQLIKEVKVLMEGMNLVQVCREHA